MDKKYNKKAHSGEGESLPPTPSIMRVHNRRTFSEVGHLPIIKDFAKKIKLVETIDALVKGQMELSPEMTILAMVLDTLSGRTPLYRLEEFFHEKDTELLLGHAIDPTLFCDYNVGRVLDKLFDTGTQKVFSQIGQNAIDVFSIDPHRLHLDTTAISVFGAYDFVEPPLTLPRFSGRKPWGF